MATRVGIHGFGRIGRQSLRATLERYPQDLEMVAVNDITNSATNAHLFRYDSAYGRSLRHPLHIIQAAKAGADVATVPFKVLEQAAKHPLTDQGIERFLADWQQLTHETSERRS